MDNDRLGKKRCYGGGKLAFNFVNHKKARQSGKSISTGRTEEGKKTNSPYVKRSQERESRRKKDEVAEQRVRREARGAIRGLGQEKREKPAAPPGKMKEKITGESKARGAQQRQEERREGKGMQDRATKGERRSGKRKQARGQN